MKIIIEIPEKTNARIRSDYGHGVKGLTDEDGVMLVDAVYHGEPYHSRPHGEWIKEGGIFYQLKCSNCNFELRSPDDKSNFCPNCGSDNRPRKDGEK